MDNRIEDLIPHLKSFDNLRLDTSMSVVLSKFSDIETELHLFEKFSHEFIAESILKNALKYLSS